MAEIFSSGAHAEVRTIGADQRLFPHSDLVRFEMPSSVLKNKLLYYGHKIVHDLFSDNFIDVQGSTFAHTPNSLPVGLIYSGLAPVPLEHATFAKHMRKSGSVPAGCAPCSICIEHKRFHEEQGVDRQAYDMNSIYRQIGIVIPYLDPSDYCLGDRREVVFFEIEGIFYDFLEQYIRQEKPNSLAQSLIGRFIELAQERNKDIKPPLGSLFNAKYVHF